MSFQACQWAINQQVITDPAARHILVVMANYAGVDGKNVWPSSERLALETGLSLRTVRYKIDLLEKVGLLLPGNEKILDAEGLRGDRRPKIFNLAMDFDGVQNLHAVKLRGANEDMDGVQMKSSRGAGAAPDKVLNTQYEQVVPPVRSRKTLTTITEWLDQFAEEDEILPPDHPSRRFAKNAGIPPEMLHLGWLAFIDRMEHSKKKQRDWPGTFTNFVKNNWLDTWYVNKGTGEYQLTSAGIARQRALEAEA